MSCPPALAESPPQALITELEPSYKPGSFADAEPFAAGLSGHTVAVTNDLRLQFSPSSCYKANACTNDVAAEPPSPALRSLKDTAVSQREIPEIVYGQPDDRPTAIAQLETETTPRFDVADQLPEVPGALAGSGRRNLIPTTGAIQTAAAQPVDKVAQGILDEEDLGTLRVKPLQSRGDEELGILRLLQTAQAQLPPPAPPVAFLVGQIGYFSSDNAFRTDPSLSEQIFQTGLSLYIAPRLSERTSLYAIAETSLARYRNLEGVSYNTLETQIGLRQRLLPRTYAQIGWRNQQLYSPGYKEKLFSVNTVDTLISHRTILNSQMWLDSFYQARWGFASPSSASHFRQTLTLSLNYGVTRKLRSSLIYQVDFNKYTQISRFDTYQQVLGVISYTVNDRSRISLFGGTRFGRSSDPEVSLSDTFYGAGLNISLPLF